jgi:hypothetical protein
MTSIGELNPPNPAQLLAPLAIPVPYQKPHKAIKNTCVVKKSATLLAMRA